MIRKLKQTLVAAIVTASLTVATVNARPDTLHDLHDHTPDRTDTGLQLWYDRPGSNPIETGLPIGNGRMGAMVLGDPAAERIAFNEDSLWTGDANPGGDYDTMGAYQAFGDIRLHLPGHAAATQYRRDLDVRNALAHVSYRVGEVTFRRELFVSHPDQVLVIRLTADTPGAYDGTIDLADAHGASPKAVCDRNGGRIVSSGTLPNGEQYEAQLRIIPEKGTVATEGTTVRFQHCDRLTLLLATGTNYIMDAARHYRGASPHTRVTRQLDAATEKPYTALRADHIQDFRSLFDRVKLDLGAAPADRLALPTDQRKAKDIAGDDAPLEALLFQYGRYLLISSSRPGGLPANLQGLWNDSNNPPWHSDYHANINIQMNYWPAEVANLAECHQPFFDLIQSQVPLWRQATQAAPDFRLASGVPTRGFAIRTSHNIYGGMGWNWDKTANAWYCRHLWEHYAFSGNRRYLQTVAYPLIKETCQFWEDHLKTLPDGRLVVPDAWSPEHGPVEDGITYSQEIVWDLFTNYIAASTALATDADYRQKITALRERLVSPKIGRWGQLQEWMTDRDDPDDHHRHTSHLYGLYPGDQIGPVKTPALAEAARKSLIARGQTGDSNREWAFAWRSALWARLGEAEKAHTMLIALLSTEATLPNLIGNHPPAQWDGNFGITAGVAEMLLQSQEGQIVLLPALPAAWRTGSITGLRARGGFVVSERWVDGRLLAATITRTNPGPEAGTCQVRYGATVRTLHLKPGATARLSYAEAAKDRAP